MSAVRNVSDVCALLIAHNSSTISMQSTHITNLCISRAMFWSLTVSLASVLNSTHPSLSQDGSHNFTWVLMSITFFSYYQNRNVSTIFINTPNTKFHENPSGGESSCSTRYDAMMAVAFCKPICERAHKWTRGSSCLVQHFTRGTEIRNDPDSGVGVLSMTRTWLKVRPEIESTTAIMRLLPMSHCRNWPENIQASQPLMSDSEIKLRYVPHLEWLLT